MGHVSSISVEFCLIRFSVHNNGILLHTTERKSTGCIGISTLISFGVRSADTGGDAPLVDLLCGVSALAAVVVNHLMKLGPVV